MSPISTTTMMMMMMLMMMMMIHHKLQQHQQTSTYIKINYDSTSNIYYKKVKNKQHPKTGHGFCNHKHRKKNQTFCLVFTLQQKLSTTIAAKCDKNINGDFIFLVLFYERSMNQNFKTHFLVSSMGMNLLLTLKIKTKVIKLSIKSKNDSNKNEIFDEN
jgi:hypothetical protein